MGQRFKIWKSLYSSKPKNYQELSKILYNNREFSFFETLDYGDHGLEKVKETLLLALKENKRIALYADYDVDGTMSCVSWIWFLKSIDYHNYIHYIPDRFKEGYGVNLSAVKHLVEKEKAELIITMDTGITANEEASWCKERGVDFICTDHHQVQADKMPDCIILNPKNHPDPNYQELCGCGITFVLIRKLAAHFQVPKDLWTDLLALTGMATICDVVPLNGVNHKLAQQGIKALIASKREVLQKLLKAASLQNNSLDEQDIGFRLGPRINAVGRLEHASQVVKAFVEENPDELIRHMNTCNEKRKKIQEDIILEAREQAVFYKDDPILFLAGNWHPGVVGIAASKIAEEFWKPTWLLQKGELCKGSARSIPGFDVTKAMTKGSTHWLKCGGHSAAGGFTFKKENLEAIRSDLKHYAQKIYAKTPELWQSQIAYDCQLPSGLLNTKIFSYLNTMRPYGNSFAEPCFAIEADISRVQFYEDKLTGRPRHTACFIEADEKKLRMMFFNQVHTDLKSLKRARFLVKIQKNIWNGQLNLNLLGEDFEALSS